jgi:hypothetical protein
VTKAATATWKWFLFWAAAAVLCLWLNLKVDRDFFKLLLGWGFLITAAMAIFPAAYVYRRATYFAVPTLEEYLRKNPNSKASGGGIRCHLCESRNIYLWFLNCPQSTGGKKVHICRGCGTKLYRSE